MRTTRYLLHTVKHCIRQDSSPGHQWMIRSGMVQRLSSGVYVWLPTGLRVLRKIQRIVRTRMKKTGAVEMLAPIMQPVDLWKTSKRFDEYGSNLLRLTDRRSSVWVLAPTHEEIATVLVQQTVRSHTELPILLFQIHTKFRDEIRPCLGTMRSKEFLMKDAYSFHSSERSLKTTYRTMYRAYRRIFTELGLRFCIARADNGKIGGRLSHEFCLMGGRSARASKIPKAHEPKRHRFLQLIHVPSTAISDKPTRASGLNSRRMVRTVVVHASQSGRFPLIALVLRADDRLDVEKTKKLVEIRQPLAFASSKWIKVYSGLRTNRVGVVDSAIPLVVDTDARKMENFTTTSSARERYWFNVQWMRDAPVLRVSTLRRESDSTRSVSRRRDVDVLSKRTEMAHIFQLGDRYSKAFRATVVDESGNDRPMLMGCYGIGITRTASAIVEQNHDESGIVWPDGLEPFSVVIIPINMRSSAPIRRAAESLYAQFRSTNVQVLLDDRKETFRTMLSDATLIGVPHTVIVGSKFLDTAEVEYRRRTGNVRRFVHFRSVVRYVRRSLR